MSKSRFQRMHEHFRSHSCTKNETELLGLFKEHQHEVEEHFEACVPALDGSDFWKYTPTKEYPLAEFHGPLFHKGFRQFDVTKSGADDRRIWELLAEGDVGAFWNAHNASMKTRKATQPKGPQS